MRFDFEKMFEERPVWTKAALIYHVAGVDKNSLRFILASVAYYFTNGPWRNAWVRIGYDPRKDPEARYGIKRFLGLSILSCAILEFPFFEIMKQDLSDTRLPHQSELQKQSGPQAKLFQIQPAPQICQHDAYQNVIHSTNSRYSLNL